MTQYIRYFIFTAFTLISFVGYAVDHITCKLSDKGIPSRIEAGTFYENRYTCTSTYKNPSESIQLSGTVQGDSSGASVSGDCTTKKLEPRSKCDFILNVNFKNTGKKVFYLHIPIGDQYSLDLPKVVTQVISNTNKIPNKVIAIYNNTKETIYPIIEAPILEPRDAWMQAQFKITQSKIDSYTFQSTKIHRAYINGTHGIPAGKTVLVQVPFYSELVANPSGGNKKDQYIDWWNAMRVYLYDDNSDLTDQYTKDSSSPVEPFTSGPSCISGCTGKLELFSSITGVDTGAAQQLTEYTFADVVTGEGAPYPIDLTHVDYDYSGVDQTYLPVAMGPYGSNLVGYTGTIIDLKTFRDDMDTFLADTGWPVYPGLTYPRIPGAYNVLKPNVKLTEPAKTRTIKMLTTLWNNCIKNMDSKCLLVNDLFQKNYKACFGSGSPKTSDLIEHIYGWVSFNTSSCGLNPLAKTPGANYKKSEKAYQQLQYLFHPDYVGDFNPYVQLVHRTLKMNVYAYSIDDAVGNINTIGKGVVITIGGPKGLSNLEQYDTHKITTVGPGTPKPGSPDPIFTKFGVCSSKAAYSIARGAPFSFQLPKNKYPCEITLEDSNKVLYHFTVLTQAPFNSPPKTKYIRCASGDIWCEGVNIDFITKLNIATPVPNK